MNLQTPIREASRAYKMYATRLEKLGITRVGDFLLHIPFRYEDYSLISKIGLIQAGEIVTVTGTVTDIKNEYTRSHKTIQKAKISDGTGELNIIWFNRPLILNTIKKGGFISLAGKAEIQKSKLTMVSPDYEQILSNNLIHTGRLVPVYPETHGVSSKWIRRQVYKILGEEKNSLREYLPETLIENGGLMGYGEAIEKIHFPQSLEQAEKARRRLAFDELFLLHLSTLLRRKTWEDKGGGSKFKIEKFSSELGEFIHKLPFELTNAQKNALNEILENLSSEKPMNRLLEGEVGSGKTVVATIAMYLAFLNGYHSVLMAPTEILAQQHFSTISKLLSPLGVKIGLQTGSIKPEGINGLKPVAQKKNRKSPIVNHQSFNILIGTHALIYAKVELEKLGLVVIDEQQRFGVEQRAMIRNKGKNPHLLTMTATPIPRTVALTVYGDLDLSLLDEIPKGRKNVKTWLVPPEKRQGAYKWIEEQIGKNKSQAFIICPFIEESENMTTVKAATKEFENLKKIFKNLKLGIIHGKLKPKDKNKVLTDFKNGKIDILVATPVVEVGIDFPNATIIMIEGAERFGLAQLHQLRGRVGRGEKQSYCLLFTDAKNANTLERLKSMEKIYVGAELAELDLKLRGPGELGGTSQHGRDFLRIAKFSDISLIEQTKKEASKIFSTLNDYPELQERIKILNSKNVSPD